MKDFRKQWKIWANGKNITSRDVFQFCLLKALTAKSNASRFVIASSLLQKAFTPASNPNKLANGWHEWKAIELAGQFTFVQPFIPEWGVETEVEKQAYTDLWRQLKNYFWDNKNQIFEYLYSYLFVRRDLSIPQQIIQVAHAMSKMSYVVGVNESDGGQEGLDYVDMNTLHHVLIGIENEEELHGTADYLYSVGIETEHFIEPDLGDSLTAIVTYPLKNKQRKFLRNYQIYKL